MIRKIKNITQIKIPVIQCIPISTCCFNSYNRQDSVRVKSATSGAGTLDT